MSKNFEIQRGKLIGQQGPGSIYVDVDGSSYILSAVDKWFDRQVKNKSIDSDEFEIHDTRMENKLGVSKFFEAPEYRTTYDRNNITNTKLSIPVARFPLVEYCQECGTLRTAKATFSNKTRRCHHCNTQRQFTQFPIVIMCEAGHIDDFPYFSYIHTEKPEGESCKRQWVDRTGPSILNWTLRCECGAHHSLTGVTGKSNDSGSSPFTREMNGMKCLGRTPWTGEDTKMDCSHTPVAVLKNSLSVYSPETIEALSITDSVSDSANEGNSFGDVLEHEYNYLTGKITSEDDNKLKITLGKGFENDKFIKSVNSVERLQQIVVQTNFHRQTPTDDYSNFEKAKKGPKESLLFSQDYKNRNWYPAKKVYGEGIFIEFNADELALWQESEKVARYYDKLTLRVGDFYLKDRFSSPISVMIHTLSHVLIRELSKHSGYPMVAIQERLYVEDDNLGLLLYVTDTDKDGTYGGLARLAKKEKFEKILNRALMDGQWCSSDPVCYELGHEHGQGIQNSNGAACHNCTFVPSTACSFRNCYLDRELLCREGSEIKITEYGTFI